MHEPANPDRHEWVLFAIIACAALIGVLLWVFASPLLDEPHADFGRRDGPVPARSLS